MYRVFRPFLLTTMVFLRDCSPGTWFCVLSPGHGVELTKLHIFTNIKSYQSEHSMHVELSLMYTFRPMHIPTSWHLHLHYDICNICLDIRTSVYLSISLSKSPDIWNSLRSSLCSTSNWHGLKRSRHHWGTYFVTASAYKLHTTRGALHCWLLVGTGIHTSHFLKGRNKIWNRIWEKKMKVSAGSYLDI